MCFNAMLCFIKKVDDLGLPLWTGIWNQFSSWLTILSVITILNSFITWMAIKIFTVVGKLRNKKSFSVKDFSQQAHFFSSYSLHHRMLNRVVKESTKKKSKLMWLLEWINISKNWFLKSLLRLWQFDFFTGACQAA